PAIALPGPVAPFLREQDRLARRLVQADAPSLAVDLRSLACWPEDVAPPAARIAQGHRFEMADLRPERIIGADLLFLHKELGGDNELIGALEALRVVRSEEIELRQPPQRRQRGEA